MEMKKAKARKTSPVSTNKDSVPKERSASPPAMGSGSSSKRTPSPRKEPVQVAELPPLNPTAGADDLLAWVTNGKGDMWASQSIMFQKDAYPTPTPPSKSSKK